MHDGGDHREGRHGHEGEAAPVQERLEGVGSDEEDRQPAEADDPQEIDQPADPAARPEPRPGCAPSSPVATIGTQTKASAAPRSRPVRRVSVP